MCSAQPGSLTVVQGVPEALVVPLGHTLFLPAADLAHSTIQALWTAQSVAGCQQIFTGQRDFFNQPGCPLAFPNIYLGLKTFTPGISKAKVVAAIGHAGPLHEALASEAANLKPLRRIILSHFDAGLPSEDGLAELVDLVRALKSSGAPMVLLCTDPLGAGPADALRGLFPSLALVDFGTWSPAVSMPAIKLPPTAPPTDMPAPAAAPAEAKMSALPRVGFLLSVDAGPPSSGLIRDIFSAMVFRSTLFLGRDVLALREILAGLAEERIPAAGLNAARAARLPEVLRALRRSIIRALVVHHWPGLALSKADSQDIGLVVVVLAPGDLPAAGTGGLAAAVQALLPGSLDARTRLLVLVPSSQLAEAKQTLPPHWLAFTSGKELHFRM
ncbi:hypothetical protein H696_01319 [Fonticula alba]|uniref:Uncharacterized protein n=1 Tax=Fonticula alba TaxID=691883 RepID=A0A058ZBY2_FONAL|nr:hypothetical protein H696_01319 [Fonticula alba]KCV71909.1 hypothetical protein H696_01319 [Fonticula alba]|eukprot:XP_009493487.1 hypothetical protein H696_01319 [Fonticula alba]